MNSARTLVIWVASFGVFSLNAQTHIVMPYNTGAATYTLSPPATCSVTFSDNGGLNNPYGNESGSGSVITFLPSAAGNKIVVQFTVFHTEAGYDALFVYDGSNLSAPQISSGAAPLLGGSNPFSGGSGGWQGSVAPYNVASNTVRATASNTSGALTFAFDSDRTAGKSGWSAIVTEVPGSTCSLQAPAALTVNAPAGACEASVQTAAPGIVPAACALALDLSYRLNNDPAVAVPAPAPPFITLNNVPVGLNVVTWQLTEPCGGGIVATATQLLTVKDQTPPTLSLPANVTLSLGPGQCTATHSYTVSASDNCTFTSAGQVDHPLDFNNGAAGIMFDLINIGTETIVITEFDPILEPGTWPMEIFATASAISWQGVENAPSAWTLLGKRTVTSTGTAAGTALNDFRIELAPGESKGIYLTSSLGAPVLCTGTGSGVQRQRDDGTLRVFSAPGAAKGYPFGNTYTSRAYNGSVKYAKAATTPVQISGQPSGSAFPIGVTNNVFQCTDQAGNTATASFSVTVQAFSGASSTLICANMVNVSLGGGCAIALQADDILLGGPYRCYETYNVQIDKIPPYTDGPWLPANLSGPDIGKTYGVRVTDPVSNNFCYGNVLVEDKIKPVLTGDTIDLPCNFNPDPTYSAPASVVREFNPTATLPVTVLDYQSVTLEIPTPMPADAIVQDVDLYLKINGDVFEKNLRMELESPTGQIAVIWDRPTGCAGPLWVRFDDEGGAGLECTQFTTNQKTKVPFVANALALFEGTQANGAWKLRVRDLNGFSDAVSVTEARLIIRYKAAFSAGFPSGLTFPGPLNQINPTTFVAPAPLLDACSDVTLSYSDETTTQVCSTGLSAIITRTWTARDASNNVNTWVQTIRLLRPTLHDVTMPPSYNDVDAPSIGCGGAYPTPAWIEGQGQQGNPRVFGQTAGCSINWSYTDAYVASCPGSYTVYRSWLVVDACTAQSMQTTQIIQVTDIQGPAIACPADLTVTTDLYNCCATVNLPDVVVEDACSKIAGLSAKVVVFNQYSGDTTQVLNVGGTLGTFPGNNPHDPDTLAAFGNTACLPVGPHHIYYRVEDACGNQKACSFKLTVRDYTAPVALGHSLTLVSLNADDVQDCYEPGASGTDFPGVTMVAATVFDQGSYDNCGFTRVTVRRVPPYSPCIEALNKVNGGAPCQDNFPDAKSEYARAIAEADSIKFYCCEAGTSQTLALRCYQVDGLGNYALGANGQPLFNETQVLVQVQDKLGPGCTAPADLTISCETFDPSLADYGLPALIDNCCLDTTRSYHGQKGLTHAADYSLFDSLCDRGTLVRTFRVFDCQGQTSSCTQKIVVMQNLDYAIRFPDDAVVEFCDSSGVYGQPVLHGESCDMLAISYSDQIYDVITNACYQIERTWRVKDLCNAPPGAGCVTVPNPTPLATFNAPENLLGPIVAPAGTAAPWTATVTKVVPTDPQATNYATFWSPTVNCYEYTQIIRVIDKQMPVVENIADTLMLVKDQTLNVGDLWNETYWYDNSISSHNLGEGPSALTITASDLCSGENVAVRFLLFLDLDNNNTLETVVNSADLPGFNTVRFGNALNANYTGGEARAFDQRLVAADAKYGFALQTATVGSKKVATVCWNTAAQPDTYVTPELPYGRHKIRWIVSDGCGNEVVRESEFEVKDSKAPTVVCHDGLSMNVSQPNLSVIWATDFLKYAEDNFTPPTTVTPGPDMLRYGIRKVGTGTGFPADASGLPLFSVSYDCTELGPQEIELWAMDLAGNASYCVATITVQDNNNFCVGDPLILSVSGALKTELGEGMESAPVALFVQPSGGGTPKNLQDLTDDQGQYAFPMTVPFGADITLTPAKDDNPLNGVSTYDLVLISKHILGQEPLGSPYKMIAADANQSNSITTFDIVEIRKLILGIYTELPNNSSWRFVDAAYIFPVPTNPWAAAFPEIKSLDSVMVNHTGLDFVGVKVGDVNNTVIPNSLISSDDRSAGTLFFDVEDRDLKTGEEIVVTFKAATPVAGYQFTIQLTGLEVLGLLPGKGLNPDNFGVFADAVTVSVAGEGDEFALRVRAIKPGRLSEMLGISSRITRAEAYLGELGYYGHYYNDLNDPNTPPLDIALRFHTAVGTTISGVGFELYQNQPNPFIDKTRVSFHLPEAAEATLSVRDETGRLLYTQRGWFDKGYNSIPLNRVLPENAGLLYYSLQTDRHSATGKMMRMR